MHTAATMKPMLTVKRSPILGTTTRTSPPWVMTTSTPTTASEMPTWRAVQPKR